MNSSGYDINLDAASDAGFSIERRQILQRVAYLVGGAVSAPAVLGLLSGCTPRAGQTPWQPVFLTRDQLALVASIAEIILPRTDTPGAIDVGVPAFIDAMLKDIYTRQQSEQYVRGLQEFDDIAHIAYGKTFVDLDKLRQTELVKSSLDKALAVELAHDAPPGVVHRPFILTTKDLTLLGFLCSKSGATQVLQYVGVPGSYEPCVPLHQAGNGKAWAHEVIGRF